jgi:threonine aldolase
MIDLRSDTVTLPSPAMRRAMADAELGDDVMHEDPTVNRLEQRAADLLGTEAAILVASGTMGNLVGIMAHVQRGGEIIAPANVHMISGEAAGHAVVAGASVRSLPWREDGTLDLVEIRDAFRDPGDPHEPLTALVSIENTHSLSMGQPLGPDYTAAVADVAASRGVPLFIDGARLFDAAVALGVPARSLVPPGASATFCLSKSLACPVGSVVVGPAPFIERVRRARKLLGGGMRQSGVFAAAGLVALDDGPSGMIDRLADDHANARRLGDALASMPGITRLDPSRIRTSFVLFSVGEPRWPDDAGGRDRVVQRRAEFLDRLAARGVKMIEYPKGMVRAMPHYGIAKTDIETAIRAVRATLTEIGLAAAIPA